MNRLIQCLLLTSMLFASANAAQTVALYETYELRIRMQDVADNPFKVFAEVTFTKGKKTVRVDGFYDGDDLWRARFMPTEEGPWNYSWKLAGASGSGSFVCEPRKNPRNHGHVRINPNFPGSLGFEDGSAYYAFGGKRFSALNYGPVERSRGLIYGTEANPDRFGDEQIKDYLDAMMRHGLNTAYIEIGLYPLEEGRYRWDLEWIQRAEYIVRQMGLRGIYCQISFFGAEARHKESFFRPGRKGEDQLFDVWSNSESDAARNYMRSVIARFASFYNVYWELGDEIVSRSKNPGNPDDFQQLANSVYTTWIREFDPYDLPIGCSFARQKGGFFADKSGDRHVRGYDIDIWFAHSESELDSWKSWGVPLMVNSPNAFDDRSGLDADKEIRKEANLPLYRAAIWQTFLAGGDGCFLGSWLDLTEPLDETVQAQLQFQKHLRNFIARLPLPYFQLTIDDAFIHKAPLKLEDSNVGPYSRQKITLKADRVDCSSASVPGKLYLSYFRDPADIGEFEAKLPGGGYTITWFNPATGEAIGAPETVFGSDRVETTIQHPAWDEDVVMLIQEYTE